MEREDIKTRIGSTIEKILGHNEFELHDGLIASEVNGWDSLTHMEIITGIEKSFGVRFRLKEINKLKNMGSLVDLVTSKL